MAHCLQGNSKNDLIYLSEKKCKLEDNKMTALSSERKKLQPGILYRVKIFFKYEG